MWGGLTALPYYKEPMATDLITLAEYKSYRGMVKTDSDTKISLLISSSSTLIKNYLRNSLVDYYSTPFAETVLLDYASSEFYSSQWPVVTVTSVVEMSEDTGITTTLVNGTDYVVVEDRFIRLNDVNWNAYPNPVIATYTAGYATAPADIKIATIELVSYYLNESYIVNKTIMGTTISNSAQGTTDIPPHIARLLDQHIG
jgi:hypothetical protein